MKRVALAAVVASALLAGPDIGSLVDYDAQDANIAKIQEKEQLAPAPVVAPLVTAPAAVMQRSSCCTNRDSIDLIGGYNFTEDSGALDDAALAGIRYNKNIAPNTYVQLGYERVFSADYRNKSNSRNRSRSVSGGGHSDGSGAGNGNGGNGSGTGNGNGGGSGTEGVNGVGGSGSNTGSTTNNSSTSSTASTQLDRFYLNGVYEFCNDNKLMPYLFAGLGYENVRHETRDLESGGFFDAGAGLKYQLNDDFNLLTEAKALKKFDNDDLDIVASLGLGFMFGAVETQDILTDELDTQLEPKPDTIPSIIPADAPIASIAEPQAPYSYDNDRDYESFDVVPIDEGHRTNSYHSPAVATIDDGGSAYYIQIAALFDSGSTGSSYINKLDRQGLDHQIKESTVRGRPIKLLLTGPYSSEAEARADLSRAKRIERGAFVKKIDG